MRFLFIVLLFFSAPAFAESDLMLLSQAVCADKPAQHDGKLYCGVIKDYPHAGRVRQSLECPLSFDYFDKPRIYAGRFTGPQQQQLLAVYHADCENHANNWGGTALFDIVDEKPVLVRYYPGQAFVGCAVAPVRAQDTAYCWDSYTGQGLTSENFGPLRFRKDDLVHETWLSAASGGVLPNEEFMSRGAQAPQCITGSNGCLSSFDAVVFTEGTVVLDVTYRDEIGQEAAQKRFEQGAFTDDEQEWRDDSLRAREVPLLREGELVYRKARLVFRAGNAQPTVDLLP